MPPYYDIAIELKYEPSSHNYYERVYQALFSSNFTYKEPYEFPELSWSEVLNWNIEKLHQKFKLGPRDHFSLDYRQFLMSHPHFKRIRVITSFRGVPTIRIIIPESEIFDDRFEFKRDSIDLLINYCTVIWKTGLFRTIQSFNSTGWLVKCEEMESGELPCAGPFAFIEHNSLSNIKSVSEHKVTSLENGYLLLYDY